MSNLDSRPGPVNARSMPRHAACRAFDPLYHLGLAEQAVSELRAEWLTSKPAEDRPDGPDDDVAREKVTYAPDDDPILDLPPYRDDDHGDYELDPPLVHDDDALDDGWDDEHCWQLGPAPLVLTMAERVYMEAERYRGWGTFLGDLLAERMTILADQFRMLDARDPITYRDRREAMLTDAVDAARRRLASGCVSV